MKEHRKKRLRGSSLLFLTIMTIMSLSSCALAIPSDWEETGSTESSRLQLSGAETQERADTGFILTGPESFDSADTPVLVAKDIDDNTVTFLNREVGKRYTLSYDGTTGFYDKYGESISLEQIQVGDIVDVTFLKSKKHLTSMQLSPLAWSYRDVERYEINTLRGEVAIGQELFKLTEQTQYLSGGRLIEQMDLNAADVLTFQGVDQQIWSVTVEKGHGYLRLANEEQFIGGWIEIGQSVIRRITEDMLLVVPEGSYQANISYNGSGGPKSVVINRNEETVLDIGDLEVAAPQYGMVLFSLTPASAELYIDGSQADTSQPVTLEYGIHQMIARASGYQTLTQYLRVGEASAGIDVVLDAIVEEEEESSTSSEESSSEAATTTSYYQVYVDAPAGAEVYVDGNYVGISPCSFRKEAGAHTVTLRRTDYITRSYSIQVDEEEKDITYSFADLVPGSSTDTESTSATESSTTGS